MEDQTWSLSGVAGLMGVSERTVRRWIKSGRLKAYKPGRDYRIPESALQQFIEESEVSPKAPTLPSLEPTFNDVLEEEQREAEAVAGEDPYEKLEGMSRDELRAYVRRKGEEGTFLSRRIRHTTGDERRELLIQQTNVLAEAMRAIQVLRSAYGESFTWPEEERPEETDASASETA